MPTPRKEPKLVLYWLGFLLARPGSKAEAAFSARYHAAPGTAQEKSDARVAAWLLYDED